MKSRVSVIIPTYNRSNMVIRAVKSVLKAIEPGDEIIVVDDGSTDNTLSRLEAYKNRVRIINATHKGAGAARNLGIQKAKNPLIAFLDSDDVWMPIHLKIHRQTHETKPEVAFSFSDFRVIDENKALHRHYLKQWHNDSRPWDEILSSPVIIDKELVYIGDLSLPELQSDFVPTFTLVAKRKAIEGFHWFAESVSTYEDLQCFGKLCFAGPAAFINKETATQYGHLTGRLTDVPVINKIKIRMQIYETIWGKQQSFMAIHEENYKKRMTELKLLLVRCLLKEGDARQARDILKSVDKGPLIYKILAYLPMPLEQCIEMAWRTLKIKF